MPTTIRAARLALASMLTVTVMTALAAPPAHAPAHGWRRQHDPSYVGYTGRQWDDDYGIVSGHCDRQAVATVLGGVVGGVIGARVAEPEDRTVATIIGSAVGALIGNRIGKQLDDADRGCFGHALEVAQSGQPVSWTNESTGVRYEMTPGPGRERDGAACREFTLRAVTGTRESSRQGLACRDDGSVWNVID